MDLLDAKNRVAEALVESIFRRARYDITPYRRSPAAGLRVGRDDFSPDFWAKPSGEAGPGGTGGSKDFLIEVKYHPHIGQFLSVEAQRGERSLFQMARRQWPELYFVLVSDKPDPGRSCFQAFHLAAWAPGRPCRSLDVAEVEEMGIFAHNVADHEELIRRIFALFTGA